MFIFIITAQMAAIEDINSYNYDECYKGFNQLLAKFIKMVRMKVPTIEHKVLVDRFEKRIALLRTTTSHDAVIKLAAPPMIGMADTILSRESAERYFTETSAHNYGTLSADDQFMYELIDLIRGLYPGLKKSEKDIIYSDLVSMLCICARFGIVQQTYISPN